MILVFVLIIYICVLLANSLLIHQSTEIQFGFPPLSYFNDNSFPLCHSPAARTSIQVFFFPTPCRFEHADFLRFRTRVTLGRSIYSKVLKFLSLLSQDYSSWLVLRGKWGWWGITKDFRRGLEQPWLESALNKRRMANNWNCSHQLSFTEVDVSVNASREDLDLSLIAPLWRTSEITSEDLEFMEYYFSSNTRKFYPRKVSSVLWRQEGCTALLCFLSCMGSFCSSSARISSCSIFCWQLMIDIGQLKWKLRGQATNFFPQMDELLKEKQKIPQPKPPAAILSNIENIPVYPKSHLGDRVCKGMEKKSYDWIFRSSYRSSLWQQQENLSQKQLKMTLIKVH